MTKDEANALWVLEEAVEQIKKYGWHQGDYGNRECGFCLMGAIDNAALELKVSRRNIVVRRAFHQVSIVLFGTEIGSLSSWNDAETTTKRKVLSTLRKAAKQYRETVTA